MVKWGQEEDKDEVEKEKKPMGLGKVRRRWSDCERVESGAEKMQEQKWTEDLELAKEEKDVEYCRWRCRSEGAKREKRKKKRRVKEEEDEEG